MVQKRFRYIRELTQKMKKDRATSLAAEQSYFYTLAIFPLLILILSIIPYFSVSPAEVISSFRSMMPSDSFEIFENTIMQVFESRSGGLLTFGIVATLWSASNGLNAFISSMNIAYEVEEDRSFIKVRLLSIILTIGLVFAFVTMLVLPVFGNVIIGYLENMFDIQVSFIKWFNVLRWLVALVVISIILSFLYYVAPNKHYRFKDVLPGAVFSTILWFLTSLVFSFYVDHFSNYSSTYGSLGGMIVLMLWLYLAGLILVIGGEINAINHKKQTPPIKTVISSSKEMI